MKFDSIKFIIIFVVFFLEVHASWKTEFVNKIKNGERPAWMIKQIRKDLQPFVDKGITKQDLNEVMSIERQLLRLEINSNKVSIQPRSFHDQAGIAGVYDAISQLAKIVHLPNVDFIVALDDGIECVPAFNSCKGPVFTFGKIASDHFSILFPDWNILASCQNNDPCYPDYIPQLLNAKVYYPWDVKIDKAFWRGTNTGTVVTDNSIEMDMQTFQLFPRVNLVQYSLSHPEIVDARFNFYCLGSEELLSYFTNNGYLGNGASIFEHLKYKYQILVDGHSCSWAGAYWRFFSDSVILKQSSPAMQWYYSLLKPYVHYIPVANDFSDLEEKIQWARKHEKEVKRIVKNANKMAKSVFGYEDIMLYIYLLLTEYAKLQRF